MQSVKKILKNLNLEFFSKYSSQSRIKECLTNIEILSELETIFELELITIND